MSDHENHDPLHSAMPSTDPKPPEPPFVPAPPLFVPSPDPVSPPPPPPVFPPPSPMPAPMMPDTSFAKAEHEAAFAKAEHDAEDAAKKSADASFAAGAAADAEYAHQSAKPWVADVKPWVGDPSAGESATVLPPVEHANWDAFKAWVRRELELLQHGHSPETRAVDNP
jgi:hypothetical protein